MEHEFWVHLEHFPHFYTANVEDLDKLVGILLHASLGTSISEWSHCTLTWRRQYHIVDLKGRFRQR